MFSPEAFRRDENKEEKTRFNEDQGARAPSTYGSAGSVNEDGETNLNIEQFISVRKTLIQGDHHVNVCEVFSGFILISNGLLSAIHSLLNFTFFPALYELIIVVLAVVMLLFQWDNIGGRSRPYPSFLSTHLSDVINSNLHVVAFPLGRLFVYTFLGLVELTSQYLVPNIIGTLVILACGYSLNIVLPLQAKYEKMKRDLEDEEIFRGAFSCTDEEVENLLKRCEEFLDVPNEIESTSSDIDGKIDHRDVQSWLLSHF